MLLSSLIPFQSLNLLCATDCTTATQREKDRIKWLLTAPPNLEKTNESESSDQTNQMVLLKSKNTTKSKVTAVSADLPAHNISVATQHLGSCAYRLK